MRRRQPWEEQEVRAVQVEAGVWANILREGQAGSVKALKGADSWDTVRATREGKGSI